jgi:hypothetical protein
VVPDQILVGLGLGREAGMEIVVDGPSLGHDHVLGKVIIERGGELGVRKGAFGLEVGDEAFGVDAGVGPGGAVQMDLFLEDTRQLCLEEVLDGLAVLLALPAGVMGALEGDIEPYGPQRINISAIWTALRAAPLRS